MTKIEGADYKVRPDIQIGDTVRLHMNIAEGDKERVQIFEGIVIALKGEGLSKTVTVRKISSGVGVERVVPLNAPTLSKVEVVKRGNVKRSKLYYMRERIGRLAMKIRNSEQMYESDPIAQEIIEDVPVDADVVESGTMQKEDVEATEPTEEVKE